MPEVRRGSRSIGGRPKSLDTVLSSRSSHSDKDDGGKRKNSTPSRLSQYADASASSSQTQTSHVPVLRPHQTVLTASRGGGDSSTGPASPISNHDQSRRSLSYALRPNAPAYYDSRAATRSEYRRRGRTLQEYYDANPHLLPQLPFTWHHGRRRWRLYLFAFLFFVDASAVPIALYYGMHYAGGVEGWIIFAVVTTVWGGPTYLEFGIRTFRLMRKERFYRPLGTESRWCFDMLTWTSVITITAVTALFVVGSAPHEVWLRVLCMPAPAILYCLGGVMAIMMLYTVMGWRAPFRISSTAKEEEVRLRIAPRHPLFFCTHEVELVFVCSAAATGPSANVFGRFSQQSTTLSRTWSPSMPELGVPIAKRSRLDIKRRRAFDVCCIYSPFSGRSRLLY